MRSVLCLAAVLVASPALGNHQKTFLHSGVFTFEQPTTPPPQPVSWTLATRDGRTVTASTQLVGLSGGSSMNRDIYPHNAGSILNWDAWANAIYDPAYTRSIVSFAGVTQESPLTRYDYWRDLPLDRINLTLDGYYWPTDLARKVGAKVSVRNTVYVLQPIPEPATLLLLLVAFAAFITRREHHGR
jgi:hypothetical protein